MMGLRAGKALAPPDQTKKQYEVLDVRKKLFAAITWALLAACAIPFAFAASDIAGHWSEAYITYLDEEGVINPSGTTGAYEPNRKVTRAEFMRYINRAFHFTEKASISYDDVPEKAWFYDTIQIATRYGYISGVSDNKMDPLGLINREQAFTILGRLMKMNPGNVTPDSLAFTDKASVSDWSAGYIKNACDKGIASGYEDGSFRPQKVITRGEVAKIIYVTMGSSFSQAGRAYTSSDIRSDTQNATISESCAVSDAVIKGDLYLTEGLDADAVTLSNVTIEGTMIVSGGTLSMVNTTAKNIIISSPMGRQLSVTAIDGCNIEKTEVGSTAAIYEKGSSGEGFTTISTTGNGRVSLTLDGALSELNLVNESTVSLTADSSVHVLTITKPSSITGSGSVYQADIQTNGVTFANSVSIAGYTLKDGVSVTVGGQNISASTPLGAFPNTISVKLNSLAELNDGADIMLPADKTVSSVTCDGNTLALSAAYTQTSTGINVSSAYLGMLSAGEHKMVITFSDNSQETVTINVT